MVELTLIYLLKVSISLAVFYFVYVCFLRTLSFHLLNRVYLILASLLSLILPLIPKTISVSNIITARYYPVNLPVIDISSTQSEGPAGMFSFLGLAESLILIWLIVSVYFLLRLLLNVRKVLRYDHNSNNTPIEAKGTLKTKTSLRYYLIYSDDIERPFSFFNNIFLPNALKSKASERNMVLEHELIHLNARHSYDKVFFEVLKALLWFHPGIYAMASSVEAQHEFYVDREIAKNASAEKIQYYGHMLLNFQLAHYQNPLINSFYNAHIKNRILMLTKEKNPNSYLRNYLSAIVTVLLLSFMWSCNSSSPETNYSTIVPSYEEMKVHSIVETMPQFIGGEDALLKFIYKGIEYPAVSRENDVEGLAVVKFIIEPDGSISNINMLRELDDATSEEVLRIMKTMPNWIPGKDNGETVRVEYTLPVRFKLQ